MTAVRTMQRMRHMVCTMLVSGFAIGTAHAQQTAAPPVATQAATGPSESAMVNLVRLLVKQGVLTKASGDTLMAQAESEAALARARTAAPATQTAQAGLPDAAPGTIRVPYIPQTVRNQIRDEIRSEVLAQAKVEGWASADQAAPEWTKRITPFGDIRFRSQSDLYSKTNSQLIFDFAQIDALGPTNLTGVSIPFLNSRVDRVSRLRVRARLGLQAKITDGVSAVFAVSTGDNNGPISTNQSLGGGLAKRDIWLDQASITFAPSPLFKSAVGRFHNPFVSSELLFDEDLRFDGFFAEFNAGPLIDDRVTLAIRGGAFPLDFGSPNFPDTSNLKQKAPVKYLYSGQVTVGAKIFDDVAVSVSGAYHSFQGVQGRFSTPCALYLGATECSTDPYRVRFPQKGNTLFGIRNIIADPTNPNAGGAQLLGLTFDYDILDINGSVRVPIDGGFGVEVGANYLRNLSFKRSDVCRYGDAGAPLNNGGAGGTTLCATTNAQPFAGGPTGYQLRALIGHNTVIKRGEWNVIGGYRYLESDAVLDNLTDSDFHLGGTNAKGYFIGGTYGILDNVAVGARWLSTNQISGEEPLAIDVFQFDIEARF